VAVVRELTPADLDVVDAHLPLNRLDQYRRDGSTYLIAWEGERPVGHAHIAWRETHLGLPELQDVFVLPERRRSGIATELSREAERTAARRGFDRISLSVSAEGNEPAKRLYEALGYRDAGVEPVRVLGTITLRGKPFEVDDTLVYLVKTL
jgi:GNAT superfamily N-acetyltransferase